jgi:hypothetical protein
MHESGALCAARFSFDDLTEDVQGAELIYSYLQIISICSLPEKMKVTSNIY